MAKAAKQVRLNNKEAATADVSNALEHSCLANFSDAEGAPPPRPEVFLIFPSNEALEIETPHHVLGRDEVERRKRYLDRRCPARLCSLCCRHPHAIPARIKVGVS